MLIIGLTKSDPETGYSSFLDGYQPGANQDTIYLTDPSGDEYVLEEIAEAVFEAMNQSPETPVSPLAQCVRDMMSKAKIRCRSLSVGDTVTVEGLGMVSCERSGWNWVGVHGD